MPKLYLRTFGCQMNEYDSDKIADVLRVTEGMERAERPEDADLIVFNTCSVREKAQEKVFADLGRVRHLKRAKPALMIAVGGCVVPYTRGEEVSRPFADVVAEIAVLARQGVKEVTLLGQNVNAWRAPITDRMADFAELLAFVSEIEGVERIRYTTSHPREFTQRLIDAHAALPKLAPHVHLPVQSGADRILAAMKRGYTTLEYRSIIRRLRRAQPGTSVTSDFIVGFPGETEADFEATLALAHDLELDDSFCFLYSPRPGTPAADLTDALPHGQKLARLQRLQRQIQSQADAIAERMVGTV